MKPSQDKAKLWNDPIIHDLELLRASYTTQKFAPHAHETFAIGVVEAGALSFRHPMSWEVVSAGQIMIIHPGEIHAGPCIGKEGVHYRMLYPEAGLLQEAGAQLAERSCAAPTFSTQAIDDTHLASYILAVHRSLEVSTTTAIERESRLLWALVQLIARHADSYWPIRKPSDGRPYVEEARRSIGGCGSAEFDSCLFP